MSNFDSYGFPPSISKELHKLGFVKPTPIQAQAIPVALSGRDMMGMAQTGTGKTAAFALPMLIRLMSHPQQTALVLAPTRELAMQIHAFVKQLSGKNINLHSALLIGGASMHNQTRELRQRPRILIATPGRLVDHLRSQPKLLQNAGILVLDEADRMLDMGFLPQLKVILRNLPKVRQTMMFSATFPNAIKNLAAQFLNKPAEVAVGEPSRPVQKIEQAIIETTQKGKNDILLDELNARQGPVLIFTRTKHRTDRLSRYLESYGYNVTRIHGNRTQAQRRNAIEGFRSGEFRILVATDIAARGLDIDGIAHVINYDLPQVPEDYIHRIGRTARNGKAGQALCLLTPEDRGMWKAISRLN
ncbi:MAG: DEAD/DEAH box helicase [Bdellovibrionales bacterium]|nr:DEAD/DEAH box helicase [Bdellovibrionales bacterium]